MYLWLTPLFHCNTRQNNSGRIPCYQNTVNKTVTKWSKYCKHNNCQVGLPHNNFYVFIEKVRLHINVDCLLNKDTLPQKKIPPLYLIYNLTLTRSTVKAGRKTNIVYLTSS